MESHVSQLLSVKVLETTKQHTRLAVHVHFGLEGISAPVDESGSWQYDFDHRISKPMGPEKAAAYAAERYFIDNPEELLRVRRAAVIQAFYTALKVA